jgi:hypothetical protein
MVNLNPVQRVLELSRPVVIYSQSGIENVELRYP